MVGDSHPNESGATYESRGRRRAGRCNGQLRVITSWWRGEHTPTRRRGAWAGRDLAAGGCFAGQRSEPEHKRASSLGETHGNRSGAGQPPPMPCRLGRDAHRARVARLTSMKRGVGFSAFAILPSPSACRATTRSASRESQSKASACPHAHSSPSQSELCTLPRYTVGRTAGGGMRTRRIRKGKCYTTYPKRKVLCSGSTEEAPAQRVERSHSDTALSRDCELVQSIAQRNQP